MTTNQKIRKGRGPLPVGLISLIILLLSLSFATADIYRWQDEEGHWHFTDSPTSEHQVQATPEASPSYSTMPAEDNSSSAADTTLPSQAGLLWRISGDGILPSYLLGTIHSEDPRVTQIRPRVADALDQSDRFVMEMTLDAGAFMQYGAAMLLPEGTNLETIVDTKTYTSAVSAMADLGIPEPLVRRLKPWVVMTMLSMPKSQGGLILDMVLYQRAAERGKQTSGLETIDEQLSVFDGLSVDDQVVLLRSTLSQLSSLNLLFEQLIKAYAADDLNKLMMIAKKANQQHQMAAAERFLVRLNDERNQRMVQRMTPYLNQGNSFIAVGALHLGGPQGLLSLLQKQGFQTEPVH